MLKTGLDIVFLGGRVNRERLEKNVGVSHSDEILVAVEMQTPNTKIN